MTLDVELIKQMIWEKPGISSYELLADLIQQGYVYTKHGDNNFEQILSKVTSCKDVRYLEEKDSLYVLRPLPVEIHITSNKPRYNCYDCDFCRLIKDNRLIVSSNEDDDVYCALDTRIRLKRQINFPYNFKCPFNEALEKYNKQLESGE